jgi:glycosyltransferase involved in cell wall biosynthesis
MNYYIIIPAHNEEAFLALTLQSVLAQTLLPKKVVVVNDNSTDKTGSILDDFHRKHPMIRRLTIASSGLHMPGSKVVNAFNHGLQLLDSEYDFLVKLDADIILPDTYFETIARIFQSDPNVGIAGGFAYEREAGGKWELNHPMAKDHVRGAFKSYTKKCFEAIGGLKLAMGWDTMDELLARFHGFGIVTDTGLRVKHLRPIGHAYNKKAKLLQGKAMYTMRYGFWITSIASLKMAAKQKKPVAFLHNLEGFLRAGKEKVPYQVSPEEGAFIRELRWKNIRSKFF